MHFLFLALTLLVCFIQPSYAETEETEDPVTKFYAGNYFDHSKVFEQILNWQEKVIFNGGSAIFFLDPAKIMKPLYLGLPGKKEQLCVNEEGKLFILTLENDIPSIYKENGNLWDRIKLPESLNSKNGRIGFTEKEGVIYLVQNNDVYFNQKNEWTHFSFSNPKIIGYPGANPILFVKQNKLLAGYNFGESGGYLVSIDLKSKQTKTLDSGLPVKSICESKEGTVWILNTIYHIGFCHSKLFSQKSGKINLELDYSASTLSIKHSTNNEEKLTPGNANTFNSKFPFGPTCISGMFIDKDGAPVIYTYKHGIFKLQQNNWTKVNDSCKSVFVKCAGSDNDGNIFLSVGGRGILMLDSKSKKYSIVEIP